MKEIKKNRKTVLLPPAIGDWTTYKPRTEDHVKPAPGTRSSAKLGDSDLMKADLMFIRLFGRYFESLQKNLDLPFQLYSCRIELVSYVDILKDIDYPLVQFRLDSPGTQNTFVCFDMGLANAFINRSVGGFVDSAQTKALTEIEENILELSASSAIPEILPGLAPSASLKYLNSPNIYFDQTIDEHMTFALIDIDVSAGKKIKGNVLLIMPLKDLQAILAGLNIQGQNINLSKLPASLTGKVTAPVTAILGSTYISAKELYELEPGDVIVLDSSIHNLLHVSIGYGLNLMAQPAIKDDRICLRILSSGSSKVEKLKALQEEPQVHMPGPEIPVPEYQQYKAPETVEEMTEDEDLSEGAESGPAEEETAGLDNDATEQTDTEEV